MQSATRDGYVGAQPVAHLILEVVPRPVPRTPAVAAAAGAAFLQCCRAGHPRVAVKVSAGPRSGSGLYYWSAGLFLPQATATWHV